MSYAIIRNVKYKSENLKLAYRHNERRNKNYSNPDIDTEKSYLNYSIKSPQYGNNIDKLACSEFWKAKDSYRQLQNEFYSYMVSNGFDLERGLPKEETNRKHYTIQEYKTITNFENTKETLKNIKLDLPETPDISSIRKIMINRDEKIENEIIKPKDKLIDELYQDNLLLHRELSRQALVIDEAEKYQDERDKILAENENLHNKVSAMEIEYQNKSKNLDLELKYKKQELENEYNQKFDDLDNYFYSTIHQLEKENNRLHKLLDKFKETFHKFVHWICKNFTMINDEDMLIRDFEKETRTFIDPEKQLEKEQREKEWYLEL